MGFSPSFIASLKGQIDIVALASEYVKLDRSGSRYKGLCPFHQEKTPSFHVNPDTGLFYCFGCHASGDTITFIEKIENLEFSDAVKFLA
jgi:DNA primase